MGTALNELALEWLTAKAVTARSTTGNSDRARRNDLARWGRTMRATMDLPVDDRVPLDVADDLAGLTTADLHVDRLLLALAVLRRDHATSSLQRMLSTMRGFCKWASRRGHLRSNPFDDDMLTIKGSFEAEVRAYSPEDVERMIDSAGEPAPRAWSAWANRDRAIVDVLASAGTRESELCALRVGDISRHDRPLLMIQRATKSGKRREVPLPRRTVEHIDTYLIERAERAQSEPALSVEQASPLFVRVKGEPFTPKSLVNTIRRITASAGATLPENALVHGFRHHFGLQLALRGVPPATLQQLMGHADPRTTAIYTRHASRDLINALDDAGWL